MSEAAGLIAPDAGNVAPAAPETAVVEALQKARDPIFWLSVGWMALVVFCAVFANFLGLGDPHKQLAGKPFLGPSFQHPFGTDTVGHDLFNQVVHGARISMIVAGSSVVVGLLVGGTIGVVAGYARGIVEVILMWITDVLLAFPALVFALALVSFAGASLWSVTGAISILSIPGYARVARAVTLTYSEQTFVVAARAMGARSRRILVKDILPNVIVPLSSFAALGAAVAVIAEGALAFLGLGVPSAISWGNMISIGQTQLYQAPQAAYAPMLAMFLTIVALNFIGERIGTAFDPREGQL